MKNVQVIDGASNATFSIFMATEQEFDLLFPDGRDMELIEDLMQRLGLEAATNLLAPIWSRPILKRNAMGLHGTLFYDNEARRNHIPPTKREVDWHESSLNVAQRELFRRCRW